MRDELASRIKDRVGGASLVFGSALGAFTGFLFERRAASVIDFAAILILLAIAAASIFSIDRHLAASNYKAATWSGAMVLVMSVLVAVVAFMIGFEGKALALAILSWAVFVVCSHFIDQINRKLS